MNPHVARLAALICLAGPATAQDAALIIGNENYRAGADIAAADDALDAARPLERAGFVIRRGADLGDGEMQALLAEHYADTVRPGRGVILLAGHFVHAAGETWLLGTGAEAPTLATVDGMALPLSQVFAIAAERPGGALILLGTEERDFDLGRGLAPGIGAVDVPQGVTLVTGDAEMVAAFAAALPDRRGQTLAEIAAAAEGLTVTGVRGAYGAFPAAATNGPAPAPAPTLDDEAAFWRATAAIATRAAYQAYLDRYSTGAHAADARAAIAALTDPVARARAAEEALALTREERRQIQRDLSI